MALNLDIFRDLDKDLYDKFIAKFTNEEIAQMTSSEDSVVEFFTRFSKYIVQEKDAEYLETAFEGFKERNIDFLQNVENLPADATIEPSLVSEEKPENLVIVESNDETENTTENEAEPETIPTSDEKDDDVVITPSEDRPGYTEINLDELLLEAQGEVIVENAIEDDDDDEEYDEYDEDYDYDYEAEGDEGDGDDNNEEIEPMSAEEAEEYAEEITDPFHFQELYAPVDDIVINRANEIMEELTSDDWIEYYETEEYKKNNSSVDDSLNDVIDITAWRRLAMSEDQEITKENYNQTRAEEKHRIDTEYYIALEAACSKPEEYAKRHPETHFKKYELVDRMLREGQSDKEIIKKLGGINPTEKQKEIALRVVVNSNYEPVKNWGTKLKTASHKGAKILDWIQKKESEHPMAGFAANFYLAGNPVYMGYRAVLSSRAIYNDIQGFKDYAVFKEVFKTELKEQGRLDFMSKNPEIKLSIVDYKDVSRYDDFTKYLEAKHNNALISEADFNAAKKFQNKQEFPRDAFEAIKAMSNLSYEEYAHRMKDKAVSKEIFEKAASYIPTRRVENYAEYKKNLEKVGGNVLSEAEYNRIRTVSSMVKKTSVLKALKDKKTRKDIANHSGIFIRSIPFIGQGIALGMGARNLVKKSYYINMGKKAKTAGNAIKRLWKAKFKDKEAWKDLYSNGSSLVAEVGGTVMLGMGVANAADSSINWASQKLDLDYNGLKADVANNISDTLASVTSALSGEKPTTSENSIGIIDLPKGTTVTNSDETIKTEQSPENKSDPIKQQSEQKSEVVTEENRQRENRNEDNRPQTEQRQEKPDATKQQTEQKSEVSNEETKPRDTKNEDTKQSSALDNIITDVNNLDARQQHDIEMLFKLYPRGASLILEGNDNPAVTDVPEGKTLSSVKLAAMWESGEISDADKQTMLEFARANFDERGNPLDPALKAELTGGRAPSSSNENQTEETRQRPNTSEDQKDNTKKEDTLKDNDVKKDGVKKEEQTVQTPEQSSQNSNPIVETDIKLDGMDQSLKVAYQFDKDGNIIYKSNPADLAALDNRLDEVEAAIFNDLADKYKNGEKLEPGAVKFLDAYAKANDLEPLSEQTKTAQKGNEEQQTTVVDSNQPHEVSPKGLPLKGLKIQEADMGENGKWMTARGEIEGAKIIAQTHQTPDGKYDSITYQIEVEDGSKIKIMETREGTVVQELSPDGKVLLETKSNESAADIAKNRLDIEDGSYDKELTRAERKALERQEREEQESRRKGDETHFSEPTEKPTSHSVKSSFFVGKYEIVEDKGTPGELSLADLDPNNLQTQVKLSNVSVREMDVQIHDLLEKVQSKYDIFTGSYHENRMGVDNLATNLTVHHAMYDDLSAKMENGYKPSVAEQKFMAGHLQDLDKFGLVEGQNGKWSLQEPAAVRALLADNQQTEKGNDYVAEREIKVESKQPPLINPLEQSTQTETGKGPHTSVEREIVVESSNKNGPEQVQETADNKVSGTDKIDETKQENTEKREEELKDNSIASDEFSPRPISGKGFEGTYTFDESGKIIISGDMSRGPEAVVKAFAVGLKANSDGTFGNENGSVSASNHTGAVLRANVMRDLVIKQEVAYDDINARLEAENREPTPIEAKFLKFHEQLLDKHGLKHDENGDIVANEEFGKTSEQNEKDNKLSAKEQEKLDKQIDKAMKKGDIETLTRLQRLKGMSSNGG